MVNGRCQVYVDGALASKFFWRHEYPRNGCYSNINNDGNIGLRALVCAP